MYRPAIAVDGLSKRFQIDALPSAYRTLRESITYSLGSRHRRASGKLRTELWALRDVSFDVRCGEVLGIIGRNGAGKSTLLKVLSQITKPTTGTVHVRGRLASLLEVGTGFHPELTGRENVFLNGAILGMSRFETKRVFDDIVGFAEVQQHIDTPVKRYSSGMYLRLGFSVAAHLNPEILIVDEVLAVGDTAFQRKCLGKMNDVAKSGRTVLFVSHNLEAIGRLCTSALMLESGCVAAQGYTHEVVSAYLRSTNSGEPLSLSFPSSSVFRSASFSINDEPLTPVTIWPGGSELNVKLHLHCKQPTHCPVAELAFYRADSTKLFGITSEQKKTGSRASFWQMEMSIECPSVLPQDGYFALGIRCNPQDDYEALWEHLGDVRIEQGTVPAEMSPDSLIVPRFSYDWDIADTGARHDN